MNYTKLSNQRMSNTHPVNNAFLNFKTKIMAKERMPLGLRPRKTSTTTPPTIKEETPTAKTVVKPSPKAAAKPKKVKAAKIGRPNTKEGKKLIKYSMDIHPELKRAVVKAAAIYDKEVHVMWNEIIYNWLEKEQKKNPGWYATIKVDKSEL